MVGSTEETPIHRPRPHGSEAAEPTTTSDDDPAPAPPTVGTICGKNGEHLTVNCPYEDLIASLRAAVGRTAARVCPARPACQCHDRAAERSEAQASEERTVRVANLPVETSERDLYYLFCRFGVLNSLHLALSSDSDEKPIGVVEFDMAEDAEQAIEWIDGHVYGGRALRVEWAAPHYAPPAICRRCARKSETCVRVRNLPEDATERDLSDLVRGLGVVSRLHFGLDEKTTSGGLRRQVGVVEFVDREDAEQAIRWLHGDVYGALSSGLRACLERLKRGLCFD